MPISSDDKGELSVVIGEITIPISYIDFLWPVPFLKQLWKSNPERVIVQPDALDRLILKNGPMSPELILTRTGQGSTTRTWSLWHTGDDGSVATHRLIEHREGKTDNRQLLSRAEIAGEKRPNTLPSFMRAFIQLADLGIYFPDLAQQYRSARDEDKIFREHRFRPSKHK